uniref:Secreted phosphoprotein 24 n=1 Tax=Amphiprion ocellaris TaxID=80972 RepID=A0A3Q1BYB1_AMPOC
MLLSRVTMKSYVLLLVLLQFLLCTGIPVHNSELESMADRGLGAALAQVNSVYAVRYLYRVTRGYVTRVVPMGQSTNDLLMTFGIKETECAKTSRSDPQTCAFRPGFFVPSYSCSSRVRVSAASAQVISLRCGRDGSSSSSESSEELQLLLRLLSSPVAPFRPQNSSKEETLSTTSWCETSAHSRYI